MFSLLSARHRGFLVALLAGVVVGVALLAATPQYALVGATNAFFIGYLAIVIPVALWRLDPAFLRRHAAEEDAPAVLIFCAMLAAAVVSAISLVLVLMGGRAAMGPQLALGAASVVFGWFAVHTMMAMHYAYEFYGKPRKGVAAGTKHGAAGGLGFAGTDEPDGTAFLYFSYTVGMTAQTSDTAVSSNSMRRLVWIHGIFAFFFNTVIVAAAVNIVVTLAG